LLNRIYFPTKASFVSVFPDIFVFDAAATEKVLPEGLGRDVRRSYVDLMPLPVSHNEYALGFRQILLEFWKLSWALLFPNKSGIKLMNDSWSFTEVGNPYWYNIFAPDKIFWRKNINEDIGSLDYRECIGAFLSSVGGFFSRFPQFFIIEPQKTREDCDNDCGGSRVINPTKEVHYRHHCEKRVLIPVLFLLITIWISKVAGGYFDNKQTVTGIALIVLAVIVGFGGMIIPLTVFPWCWG
jgi:hypothetical protein